MEKVEKKRINTDGALALLTALIEQCFVESELPLREAVDTRIKFADSKTVDIWSDFSGTPLNKVRSAIINYNKGLLKGRAPEICTDLTILINKYGIYNQ